MRRQATQPLLGFWECRQGCLVITGTYPLAGRSDPDLAADKAYRNTSVKYSQAHNTWTLHLRNTYVHTYFHGTPFSDNATPLFSVPCALEHTHYLRANSHQRHTLHLTKQYPTHTCSCTPRMFVHTYLPVRIPTVYL